MKFFNSHCKNILKKLFVIILALSIATDSLVCAKTNKIKIARKVKKSKNLKTNFSTESKLHGGFTILAVNLKPGDLNFLVDKGLATKIQVDEFEAPIKTDSDEDLNKKIKLGKYFGKMKLATIFISTLKDNTKILEEARNKPGRIARFWNWIKGYDPAEEEKKKKREMIYNLDLSRKEAMLDELLNEADLASKSISSYHLNGICWFLGKQKPAFFEVYRKKIKEVLVNFLKSEIPEEFKSNTNFYNLFSSKYISINKGLFSKSLDVAQNLKTMISSELIEDYVLKLEETYKNSIKFEVSGTQDTTKIKPTKSKLLELSKFKKNKKNYKKFRPETESNLKEKEKSFVQAVTHHSKIIVDKTNSLTKKTIKNYERLEKIISKCETCNKLNEAIKFIKENKLIEEVKKKTVIADIISLTLKIQEGKNDCLDNAKLVILSVKALGGDKIFPTTYNYASSIVSVLKEVKEMGLDKPFSRNLASLLLISSTALYVLPVPIPYKNIIAQGLQIAGSEIKESEVLKKIIDNTVEKSVNEFVKAAENQQFTLSSSFYSDFAMDIYISPYNSQDNGPTLADYFKEKKDKIIDTVSEIKSIVEESNEKVESAYKKDILSPFAVVMDDFASDIDNNLYSNLSTYTDSKKDVQCSDDVCSNHSDMTNENDTSSPSPSPSSNDSNSNSNKSSKFEDYSDEADNSFESTKQFSNYDY